VGIPETKTDSIFESFTPGLLDGLPVLVVDDHETTCMILQEILTQWDMKPQIAKSGPEALKSFPIGRVPGTFRN